MRKALSIIILTVFQTAYGQDSLMYRTDIGINIAPAFAWLLGGEPEDKKNEIIIKQRINTDYTIKAKLSYYNYPYNSLYVNNNLPYKSTYIMHVDSIDKFEDIFSFEICEWGFYMSVEKTIKIKKAELIVGFGVIPGLIKNRTVTYHADYKNGNMVMSSLFGMNDYYNFKIGATPYLAIILPVNSRLYILTQTGFEWNYYFSKIIPYEGSEADNIYYSFFRTWPIIGELSIMYRFRKK